MNAELEAKLERAEMRMVSWMCGVSLREKTNAELRESMGIEKISYVMRCSRLRWMGHVLRKEGNDWVKKSMEMTVKGSRGRGRPKMTSSGGLLMCLNYACLNLFLMVAALTWAMRLLTSAKALHTFLHNFAACAQDM